MPRQDTRFRAHEHAIWECRILFFMHGAKIRELAVRWSLLALMSAGAAHAAPVVETAASEIDLGELVRGAAGEARFTLRNTGDETLRILGAEPG